jgi:competence protein ComEC
MHPDHIGGAYFIVPKFKIAEILDNGQALDPKDVVSGLWYKKLARDRNNYRSLKHGDVLKIGDRAELEILRPVQTGMTGGNDASLVMKLKYGKFSCLLMGDLRYPGEKELLESGRDLKADILKVGHSGWKDATTQDFLDAVNPKAAVICVGEWGGPSKEILARLKEKNVKTYRTDAGDIVVTANKDGSYDIRQ